MAEESIELVRRCVATWSRGDLDAFISFFDPDCEVVFRPDVPEPGPFRGRAELRGWAEGFRSAWEAHSADVVEVESSGDRVLVLLRLVGRSAAGSFETDDTWPFVFTVRNGLVARWQGFGDAAEARKAVVNSSA